MLSCQLTSADVSTATGNLALLQFVSSDTKISDEGENIGSGL